MAAKKPDGQRPLSWSRRKRCVLSVQMCARGFHWARPADDADGADATACGNTTRARRAREGESCELLPVVAAAPRKPRRRSPGAGRSTMNALTETVKTAAAVAAVAAAVVGGGGNGRDDHLIDGRSRSHDAAERELLCRRGVCCGVPRGHPLARARRRGASGHLGRECHFKPHQ